MKATFKADGDVIIITGGANGIGRELALTANAAGAKVVVCDISDAALRKIGEAAPGITTRLLDVSDRDAVATTFADIQRKFGRIDGLVCAAAIQPRTAAHEMDAEEWQRVMAVNLNGVVWCYQAAAAGMIARRRGSIIVFSSGLAHQGWPKASAYASTKAALIAFVKSVAKEVSSHAVKINIVWPGVIDTDQYRAANPGAEGESWKNTLGVGSPADVVGPLMFLLSDAATMTGSMLTRDMAYPLNGGSEQE